MAQNKLIAAARRGEVCRIRKLLAQPEGPAWAREAMRSTGQTALMIAAELGHADCVRALAPSSRVLETDRKGIDALCWAADANQAECVSALLESEALAWASSPSAWREARSILTALDSACGLGHESCVRAFLDTPIGRAAARSESGAASPLHSAVACLCPNRVACIKALVAVAPEAARRSWLGQSPLMRAAVVSGNADCIRLLAGPTVPHIDDDHRRELLHVAMRHQTAECLQALLDTPACAAAAKSLRRNLAGGETLVMKAVQNVAHLQALAPHSEIEATDDLGITALRHAIEADQDGAERVRILVAAGASPWRAIHQTSEYDKSPLRFAVVTGRAAAVDAMLPASEPQAIHSAVKSALSRLREADDPVADSARTRATSFFWSRGHAQALDALCAIALQSDHFSDDHAELRVEALGRLGPANMPKTYALVEAREIAQALKDAPRRVELAAAPSTAPDSAAKDESATVSAPNHIAHAAPRLRAPGVGARPRRM